MIRATVRGFERFGEITADIDRLCITALNEAAAAAAETAQQAASIDLELDIQHAEGDIVGFSSGIESKKEGKTGARIAPFFDAGTLSNRTRKLKRSRRETWQVNRGGSTYSAHRQPLVEGEGISAERFFSRARSAGRNVLLARIDRGT